MKLSARGFFLIVCLVIGCSKDPASLSSNSSVKGSASIHLIADSGSAFGSLAKSAYAVVHADGMDTIRQSLSVSSNSVTGIISNIPAGPNRIFDVFVLDSQNSVCYFGEGISVVNPGATVTVKLTIYRSNNNGSAIIDGRIVDSLPTPQCFVLDTQVFGNSIQIRKVCNGDTILIIDSIAISNCVTIDSTPLNKNSYRILKNCNGILVIDTIFTPDSMPPMPFIIITS